MSAARACRPSWDLALDPLVSCKLCLGEYPVEQMTTIAQCQCVFCTLVGLAGNAGLKGFRDEPFAFVLGTACRVALTFTRLYWKDSLLSPSGSPGRILCRCSWCRSDQLHRDLEAGNAAEKPCRGVHAPFWKRNLHRSLCPIELNSGVPEMARAPSWRVCTQQSWLCVSAGTALVLNWRGCIFFLTDFILMYSLLTML